MPSPPTAASLPVQNLLSQLSSEFERLQKQNEDLARENLQLHAAFTGADPACTALYANGDKSKASSGLHSKCNCLLAESLVRNGQMTVDSGEDAKAAPKVPDSLIRDVFDQLDVHNVGMLYLQDLVHIMRSAGKPIEPDVLVNAVRASNDEEPIRFDARGEEFTEAERLMCVDVRAFSRLLDGSLQRRLGSGAGACLEGLREACWQRATRTGKPGQQQKRLDNACSRLDYEESEVPEKQQRARYEAIPAVVIFLNMVLTGLSIDNPAQEEAWEAAESVFACWYLLEFLVKLRMLGCRGFFWGPEFMWNWFDTGCLVVSFIDPTVKVLILTVWKDGDRPDLSALMMIKMFRLARLARLVRILRFKIFHELKIMILGVFSGLRVLTWAIVLLVMLTYLVGVGMTYLVGVYEPEFRTVSQSMLTLFRCWTEGCAAYDGTPLVERLRETYGHTVMVFYILITMFVTAEIESSNHFELFDVLDADMGGELSMDELTTGLMKLRGPVTKADIVAVRLKVRHLTMMLENASSMPRGLLTT